MARVDFPIQSSFGQANFNKISAERLINMYVVKDNQAKKPIYCSVIPGTYNTHTVFDQADGGFRSSLVHFDTVSDTYWVYTGVGDRLYEIEQVGLSLVATQITTSLVKLNSTMGYLAIADLNNSGDLAKPDQVLFTDGSVLYLWIKNGTQAGFYNLLTQVPPAIPSGTLPQYVCAMDGFFIVIIQNSLTFYVSGLFDGLTTPYPYFAAADTRAGKLLACQTLGRRLYLFGDKAIESWVNIGSSKLPFRRDNNVFIEHGLLAVGSLAIGSGRLFYLANSQVGTPAIMMIVEEAGPQQISTHFLDLEIEQFSAPQDAIGFAFRISGQLFYQINFTTDNKTFLYNLNSDSWSELQDYPVLVNGIEVYGRHRAQTYFYFNNFNYVGDYTNSNLYVLDPGTYNNNGMTIKKSGITHVFYSDIYNRREITRVLMDTLNGFGNDLIHQSSPTIFLFSSNDGGQSYQPVTQKTTGGVGQYWWRTFWYRLGAFYSFSLRWECYDDMPMYLLGGAIDYEEYSE